MSNRSDAWKEEFPNKCDDVRIVFEGSRDECIELEMFLISEIGLDNLINATKGGKSGLEGRILSEETKKRISEAKKGCKGWNKGRKLGPSPMKGKLLSFDSKFSAKYGIPTRTLKNWSKNGVKPVSAQRKSIYNKYMEERKEGVDLSQFS